MNSFSTQTEFHLKNKSYVIYRLRSLKDSGHNLDRLPYSLRILLENLLRNEDGITTTKEDIQSILNWDPKAKPSKEISFTPARVLLQDFTGVPCVVDLASMRETMIRFGADPNQINPLQPVELVIDHSVQVDAYGTDAALNINLDLEFKRNQERYEFLRWGQQSFQNFKVVPPNTGIVHQVNLEYLARVAFFNDKTGHLYPDTLVGTDSHTTMVNSLGVLGWGVGGIEAEAAMLGQPISMLLPQVVGFRLTNKLKEGSTATDLVLTITEMLRQHGVVGKFVEFFGDGLDHLPLADRATIANMAPEYGATCGIFPVDAETIRYLQSTGRDEESIELTETYFKEQGLFHTTNFPEAEYSSILQLDLSTVEPSVAGPKRPQDRLLLGAVKNNFQSAMNLSLDQRQNIREELTHGSIVIAAITSCTNTSNPSVMVGAGLLAQKAVEKGLKIKPWVKTSLAPGSKVAKEYLGQSGLQKSLDKLGFQIVGYGCTTCIGNSGPLPEAVAVEVRSNNLTAVSVLSGNRNFEGRVNPDVKANYLMSPPLVVAYALAGNIQIDLTTDPIGYGTNNQPVYLKDIWPSENEIQEVIEKYLNKKMFQKTYATVFEGDKDWQSIPVGQSNLYPWNTQSTYIKEAPYFDTMSREVPSTINDLSDLRALALLGDSITTDHISPAGNIKAHNPAGEYLMEHGIDPKLFNSYGSRRGNHEVMIRGTFANIRLKNQLAPGTEGGFTTYFPTQEVTTIYEASQRYQSENTSLIVIAGKEYGTGSSRDWAAKGTALLGVKVVLAESFERIHRSNLIGMGVLPLQFLESQNAQSLGLTGQESYTLLGLKQTFESGQLVGAKLKVQADEKTFEVLVRIDTPREVQYYQHGGILPYVVRQFIS